MISHADFMKQTDPKTIPQYFVNGEYHRQLSLDIARIEYMKIYLWATYTPPTEKPTRNPMSYTEAEIAEMFRIFEETGE
jgi:hypothetical protein